MERQRNKKHLVITKSFYDLLAKQDENTFSKGETTMFDGTDRTDLAKLVKDLEQFRANKGTRIHIFDVAIMTGGRTWAFVEDSINRSGTNPLRQLSGLSTTRFIDVGQLYLVPNGNKGITILSLGTRFNEVERGPISICSHLHTIAVIAHAMNFEVSAIVVSEEKFEKVAFGVIERLG